MPNCFRRFAIRVGLVQPPRPPNRKICVGNNPGEVFVPDYKYPANEIVSARYTILNFLPKNLFEQFQRIANFYFLCIAIIQLFIDSPVNPATSILPLVFVIGTTMAKQGYEDFLRHRADSLSNNRPIEIIVDGHVTSMKSMEIRTGDVVRCRANDSFPCDLVMISSSEPEGFCFVTTASLDGETNLKTFKGVPDLRSYTSPLDISEKLKAYIQCQEPIEDLYKFVGQINIKSSPLSKEQVTLALSSDNLLLRGARLKNTDFVYGCAVYTGQDTKMALNSRGKKIKFSQVERRLNYFLACYLILLMVQSIFCTSMKYIYTYLFVTIYRAWYISPELSNAWRVVQDLLSFIVIFNYLIPISLYVTIELQKFFGSMFFAWDLEMFDEASGNPARANTSDLNEELGQIEYLFSDKTGTLTENDMQFRQCSINGIKYVDLDGVLCLKGPEESIPQPVLNFSPEVEEFLTILALCHTIRVEIKGAYSAIPGDSVANGGQDNAGASLNRRIITGTESGDDYDYQASSPDEKSFVDICRRYGIVFHGTINDHHVVTFKGNKREFRLIDVLEFDSDRKCMSVILRDEEGRYHIHCKGAESSMLSKVRHGESASADVIMKHVTDYAVDGLRTLVIGTRLLSETEFKALSEKLSAAKRSLEDRETKVAAVYSEVEQNLRLVGCTGIEDKLQDGVKETIEDLRTAGIQVWILTGDKEETAVNISHSAGHFSADMKEIRITRYSSMEECRRALDNQLERINTAGRVDPEAKYALVVDGQSLAFALMLPLRDKLVTLCLQATTVLCCRMTPLQKAEVVSLIKSSRKPEPVTAAIGDGANDVSMILEAHVGIGLYGKEGYQAVRASDYAFARFRFLRRALLLHGHFYYIRIANLVQYFFYKNITFISAQIYFAFFSAFSAQTIYETSYLMLYNMTFTSLPIFLYGLFEQHCAQDQLISRPELYRLVSHNSTLSWMEFIIWNVCGVWHSLVAFFGVILFFRINDIVGLDGMTFDVITMGTIVMLAVWLIVTIKLLLISYFWQAFTLGGILVTYIGCLFLMLLYNGVVWSFMEPTMFWVWFKLLSYPSVWLLLLALVIIGLTPDIAFKAWRDNNHISLRGRQAKVDCSERHRNTSLEDKDLSLSSVQDLHSNTNSNPSYPIYHNQVLNHNKDKHEFSGSTNLNSKSSGPHFYADNRTFEGSHNDLSNRNGLESWASGPIGPNNQFVYKK